MRQGYGYRNRRHLRLRILLEVAASWLFTRFPLKDGEPIACEKKAGQITLSCYFGKPEPLQFN
jgi:hypothetical protein